MAQIRNALQTNNRQGSIAFHWIRRNFVRQWIAVAALLAGLVLSTTARAQNAEFTQNKLDSNTMTMQVPLGGHPGRGASLPISLYYSSKVWRVGFIKSVYVNVWGYQTPRAAAEAIYAEHSTAGWTTSLDIPKVEWPKQNDLYKYDGRPYPRGTLPGSTYRIARVYIHMPDGSTHELRKSDQPYPDNGTIDVVGTFYAVDGSRMRYDSTSSSTGTLYLADGTRYVLNSSTAQYIDRNGNTLNYDSATRQWSDTLGRVIGQPLPATPAYGDFAYVVPGQNGGTVTYTFKWRNLADVLTQAQSLKCASDRYLPYPDQAPTDESGNNFPQPTGAASLFHSDYSDETVETSYTYVVGRGQVGSNVFNPVVLSEIVLPNGQSYKFTYNIDGEIDKVIYPTGAYQRYQYDQVASPSHTSIPYDQGSRGVTSRWVSPNGTGGTDESQWLYEASIWYGFVVKVTAPNGTRTETVSFRDFGGTTNFGFEPAWNGMPFEERVYAPGQNGAMLRRTLTEFAQSSASYNRPSPGTGTYTAYRNARPIKTVSLILDTGGNALASGTTSQYDLTYQFTVGADRTQTEEYPYSLVDQTTAQTGAISAISLGTPVRSTETAFLTSDANYRNRNILGLASSTVIKDGTGTIVSQATVSYDEPGYPLIQYGSVTGWTDPQTTYRGNVTTVSRWLDYPTPTWVSTHTQYDQCGSVKNVWDALGRMSQVDYSSTYAFAYPTTTTSVVPDPSGTYGQPTAFVSTSVYDLNTGLVTSSTDANGRTTSFEYNDPLDRVTKVNRPDGGWTSTSYSDVPGNNYVRTQTLQHTTPTQQVMESYQFFDKAGRASRSFANEGATYLTADTQYDNLGRVSRVSNPYRTTALTDPVNPSGLWSTTTYDDLSRPITVTTPDSAQVTTSYGANLTSPYFGTTVTATDPTSKARKSVTDAQGRLIQAIEDPNGLGYQTNYTYDVLNNLRKVEQGSQLRYFGYDSFSRVIRARNVEQAIQASLAWTDPVTGYSGWTAAVSYDVAGNVQSRTDARNVTTNFTYDALNRVTTVRYVNDPQNTPGIDTYYDGYRGGVYQNVPDNKGRAWQVETLGQVLMTADLFDVLGHVKTQRQQFWTGSAWGTSYPVQGSYNLAGQVTSQTYPSGRSVAYAYDQSGRLNTFSGNLGDGISRTYANEFQYNEWSGLQQEKFGTATPLYHKQRFNVRGQLWDVRLSSVAYATDPANGDRGAIVNYYSGAFVQGGSGTDNNGQVLRQENYIPGSSFYQQTYAYDSLNRLNSVAEKLNGTGGDSFKQAYLYDRFGNRTIDQALTTANVPRLNYTVDLNTNRLTAPAGYTYGYDFAGNQNNDTYTGAGARTFDAENRMISAQGGAQLQYYKYSGGGQRVRRIVSGVETWQVYGLGGELLAEYAANAAPASPQREYGYRNGQLLITAEATAGWGSPPLLNDNPLVVGETTVQSRHITELRALIDALRGHLGLSAYSWLQPAGPGYLIKADPILEMRTALDQGLGPPSPAYSAGLAQYLPIKAIHIQELRNRALTAWNSSSSVQLNWLVADHLGTPRMSADQSGSLAGIRRHDYLPFGEEIGLIGGRSAGQGYIADNTRQKFTGYEADAETGLNFAQARYQSPTQGRFISVDPFGASASIADPQSFNRYAYVSNDPINLSDPNGLMGAAPDASQGWSDVSDGFWGSGNLGGKGWGSDPRPGRTIVNGQFLSDIRYTVRWQWTQYTDSQGEEHTYGWWEKSWNSQPRQDEFAGFTIDSQTWAKTLTGQKTNGSLARDVLGAASAVLSQIRRRVPEALLADGLQLNVSVLWVFNGNLTVSQDLEVFGGLDTPNVAEIIRKGFASAKTGRLGRPVGASVTTVKILAPNVTQGVRHRFFNGPNYNVHGGFSGLYGGYTNSGGLHAVSGGFGTPGVSVGGSYSSHLFSIPRPF
jgi:RHS repeat-associated protein